MKFKLLVLFFLCLFCKNSTAQIPILNSYPNITNKVIYLDFDGQVVSATGWNNGNTVNASPSNASANSIRLIWQRMSEDYRPFDVNITTDSLRFINANPTSRIRVIFTPTYQWYGNGAGGVAFLGSFTWGGYPGTPCWIFESQLGNNSKSMAEAASHEVGHTLSLKHQSTYNSACTKTNEYNPGLGNGVTSWAPIMGVGYSKNVTLFHNGKSADGCNLTQNDISNSFQAGITGLNYLNFLPDDVGNNFQNAKILNLNTISYLDSGLVNTTTDIDAFRFTICNNRYVSIAAKPWAIDTVNYSGANLDVKLKLYNAAGTLIASDSAISKLHALVGLNLTAGSYFFTIDGDASAYYTDYGVLGKYFLNIKSTNPPPVVNTINLSSNICSPQTINLNFNSNISTSVWQWTVSGANSNTFNTQNPSYAFTTPGIYTISLIANSSSSLSCITTKTLNVGSVPSLSSTISSPSICPQNTGLISVSGASTYVWMPGNLNGTSQIVNPNSVTAYTIFGYNGTCSSSISQSIGLSPDFTLNVSYSSNNICAGSSLSISPSGAINYTLLPSGSTSPPFVVFPTVNTTYTVIANNNACKKSKINSIQVNPSFTIGVDRSDSIVCINQPVTIFAYGAINYTTNPGGQIGYQVVVTPTANTVYTVTGIDNNQCTHDSTFLIQVKICDLVGLSNNQNIKSIQVFPNPSNNYIHISSVDFETDCEIMDATGKKIASYHITPNIETTINAATWCKGIYLFQFKNEGLILKSDRILIN